MGGRGFVLAAVLAAVGGAAAAQPTSETLYRYKHWEVEGVRFEDGSLACLAEVDAGTDSFTIWYYQTGQFRLQFYSTGWNFGDPGSQANLQIRIDRRSPWNLTNADLYKNSVLFYLPDNNTGVRFLTEVARGNTLYLNDANGVGVKYYSLAGSQASMGKLVECGEAITPSSGNPFN